MNRNGMWLLSIVLPAVVLAACAPSDTAEDAAMAGPDTTGASVWAYLQETGYQDNWNLWPGKGELYTGQEPHGMLLTTYLNGPAFDAVNDHAGSMPAGAIVVKENYMPDSTLAAVTTMYKVPGFNPDHNDWFFVKQGPDGAVEVEGRGAGCQACHGGVSENDYIFTGPLTADEDHGH